jgi:hypothetical protein
MKWTKFSEKFPTHEDEILVYDGKRMFKGCVNHTSKGYAIKSDDEYCNRTGCTYIPDNCGCDIELNDNSWWMPLPEKPDLGMSIKSPDIDYWRQQLDKAKKRGIFLCLKTVDR